MSELAIAGVPLAEVVTLVVLLAQAVASSGMCGLIWFVQLVHYPLFSAHAGDRSRDFAAENQVRTGRVVIPFMAVEAAAALAIALWPPAGISRGLAVVSLAVLAVAWASTFLVQVPLHARLAREGHAPDAVAALVRSNWIRTVAWTARGVLAAWMLRAALPLTW
ncbi:MAG: hypothetical protein ACKON8_02375 [Planctomycetota bacterium]